MFGQTAFFYFACVFYRRNVGFQACIYIFSVDYPNIQLQALLPPERLFVVKGGRYALVLAAVQIAVICTFSIAFCGVYRLKFSGQVARFIGDILFHFITSANSIIYQLGEGEINVFYFWRRFDQIYRICW